MASTYGDTYSKMRWFIERNRMALVQLNSSRTSVDDLYTNLPIGTKVRVYGAKIAQYFDAETTTLKEIPEQFHEAIVYKAIANGYEIPPTQNFQAAQYFNAAYSALVKEAKKWKRVGRLGGVQYVKPIDF